MKRLETTFVAAALVPALLVSIGCATAGSGQSKAQELPVGTLCIAVSVDWEGAYLDPAGLSRMAAMRSRFPRIPLTQFLNAAFLTRDATETASASKAMASVIRPEDELGLHLHAWDSLVLDAGVRPRFEPRFFSDRPLMSFGDDAGFEVVLDAYEVGELEAIVATARRRLEDAGFSLGPSFRAGGWLATSRVHEAIRRRGFLIDSSATPPGWYEEQKSSGLFDRLERLWARIEESTQPYVIDTQAGALIEMPDSGGLADYLTAEEMIAHVEGQIARLFAEPGRNRFAQLGLHQETASEFLPRLERALDTVLGTPSLRSRVRFERLSDCARSVGLLVEQDSAQGRQPVEASGN